jgi:transposase
LPHGFLLKSVTFILQVLKQGVIKVKKKRLTVRKIREIFRLHFVGKLSNRQIAEDQKVSKTTVQDCIDRFNKAALTYPFPAELTDEKLHARLYPGTVIKNGKQQPVWEDIVREMSRRHVTLTLLWEEYRDTYPDGLGRTQFYEHYKAFCGNQEEPVMRNVHKGGEKIYVDFSGDGLTFIDKETGGLMPVKLFVACWAASSYCFAEVSMDRTLGSWITLHRHMFRYFGCVAELLIPDNEKAGVTKADKYEPELQNTYAMLGEHYGTVILPTRPHSPRDKAAVESNVLHIQRFILGRLRNRTFFSLVEVNDAVKEELDNFNNRPMQLYKATRKERFIELDKPFAKLLPTEEFPYVDIKTEVRVGKDYHIEYQKSYYSVPHGLCGERVEVRRTNQVIEIIHKMIRVTSHTLALKEYSRVTNPEHMPVNHKFVKGWTPGYFLNKASNFGIHTVSLCKAVMKKSTHPEQSYRSLMGLFSLQRKCTPERIERAAERAMHYNQPYVKVVKNILETGKDKEPIDTNQSLHNATNLNFTHENIRGSKFYSTETEEMEMTKCY